MAEDLAAFLSHHEAGAEGSAVWGGGALSFRVTAHLASVAPPLQYVTSVRSLVFRGKDVLVLRQPDGSASLLPGGRCEAGERLEDTLRREVLEETGWIPHSPVMLGVLHFHHRSPRPEGYAYPYPDFLQVVYMSGAGEYQPAAMVPDEYVIDALFRPIRDVLRMEWTLGERLFLDEALAVWDTWTKSGT